MSKRVILLVIAAMVAPIAGLTARDAARGASATGSAARPTQSAATQPATQPAGGEAQKREEQLLAMLKCRDQANYEAVLKLKETDPAEYRRYVRRASGWLDELKDMPPQVAEAHMVFQETKVKLWRLAELLRTSRSKRARSRLTEQVHQTVERLFDAESLVLQYRVEHLRQDIDRLEKKLKDRSARREELIKQQIEQVLNPTTQPAGQERHDTSVRQP